MILYHGSNVIVEHPKLVKQNLLSGFWDSDFIQLQIGNRQKILH